MASCDAASGSCSLPSKGAATPIDAGNVTYDMMLKAQVQSVDTNSKENPLPEVRSSCNTPDADAQALQDRAASSRVFRAIASRRTHDTD